MRSSNEAMTINLKHEDDIAPPFKRKYIVRYYKSMDQRMTELSTTPSQPVALTQISEDTLSGSKHW
jgi:hypothetical protein